MHRHKPKQGQPSRSYVASHLPSHLPSHHHLPLRRYIYRLHHLDHTTTTAMCRHMIAYHNCGHTHQWFARCIEPKKSNTPACNMPQFPVEEYQEGFPCPVCAAQRTAETRDLLDRGRRTAAASQTRSIKREEREGSHLPGQAPVHSQQDGRYHHMPDAGEAFGAPTGDISGLMHNVPENNTQRVVFSPQMPWVPPSSRHAEIVRQVESSSPAQTTDVASIQSWSATSVDEYSRPASESTPQLQYPSNTPLQASQMPPGQEGFSPEDMELVRRLRQPEP